MSLIQRVRLSSLTSPAASDWIIIVALLRRNNKINSIETKKDNHRSEGDTFVSIDKRMIARDAEHIRGRQRSEIILAVSQLVLRSGQCGFAASPIVTHAIRTSEQRQLLGVNIYD